MTAVKALLLVALLAAPGWQWLAGVRQRNAAVATAQAAARRGRWTAATAAWQAAMGTKPTPALLLNLAYAQARAQQEVAARCTFGRLLRPGTPLAAGSTARQQLAQLTATTDPVAALGLLREALRLDPANAVARRNYERLQAYLQTKTADKSTPPPATPPKPDASRRPKPAPTASGPAPAPAPQPAAPSGGQPQQPTPETPAPSPLNGPKQPGLSQPKPGAGPRAPLPTGPDGGTRRGLDSEGPANPIAPTGRSPQPGVQTASAADMQRQTQRQRLQALNLTPAQVRQLLETLRAQEQQYLQQVRHPAPGAPADSKLPTW